MGGVRSMFRSHKSETSVEILYVGVLLTLLFLIFGSNPAAAIRNGEECSRGTPTDTAVADARCTENTGNRNQCRRGPTIPGALPWDVVWYCMDTQYNCALPGGEGSFGKQKDKGDGHPIKWFRKIYTCQVKGGVFGYFQDDDQGPRGVCGCKSTGNHEVTFPHVYQCTTDTECNQACTG